MFDAGMRTTLAQRLVSIALSAFDQTCLNRLATHFKISMFGHQTMFDGIKVNIQAGYRRNPAIRVWESAAYTLFSTKQTCELLKR